MATHFSILALKIPLTEHPGMLQSTESQRVLSTQYAKKSVMSSMFRAEVGAATFSWRTYVTGSREKGKTFSRNSGKEECMGTGCVKIVVGLRVVIDGARINTKSHKVRADWTNGNRGQTDPKRVCLALCFQTLAIKMVKFFDPVIQFQEFLP